MSLYERFYPKIVSFVGSLGLGTALTFFFGIGLAFQSGFEKWADLFFVWGPWFVIVPGALLIAHLYMRTHLGRWFVERGCVDEALAYTSERLGGGLLRSRKEALYHRIYLARAKIYQGSYAEALETLTRGFAMPDATPVALAIYRWQMEAALRLEDGQMIDSGFASALELEAKAKAMTEVRACRAEWAVLEGNGSEYQTHIEEARWSGRQNGRADFAEALALLAFGHEEEEFDRGLELLRRCRAEVVGEIPCREAEIDATRSQLLVELGRESEAKKTLKERDDLPFDERAERAVERARARLEERRSE